MFKTLPLPPELIKHPEKPFIIAHRGDRDHAPENSMAAFRLGLAGGAHGIETDLHLTADRQIVCFHDEDLERMTGVSGRVQDKTLAELQTLRLLGNGRERYPNEKIPTLDEVLSAFKDQTYFLLELKRPSWLKADEIQILLALLEKHDAFSRVMIASFAFEALELVKSLSPLPTAPIIPMNPFPPAGFPLIGVWYPMLFVNPLYVWLCHRRGQYFCPLDPRPEARLWYYLRLGVDCLLSDHPAETKAALKKLKSR